MAQTRCFIKFPKRLIWSRRFPNHGLAGNLLEIIGPALLLGPELLVVSVCVVLELDLVGVDNLLAAVLALH